MRRRSTNRPNRSRLARAGLLVCAVALGSIALACGDDAEPGAPAPAATPAEPTEAVPQPTPPAAVTPDPADEGEGDLDLVETEGVIPEGFPSDVPVYPGANIGSSMTAPGLGVFTTLNTDDAVETILTYYRSELAKNGWSVVDTAAGDGVDGTKGERKVAVRARPDGDRTELAINVSGS